jgi:hypothetical protein
MYVWVLQVILETGSLFLMTQLKTYLSLQPTKFFFGILVVEVEPVEVEPVA